MMKKILLLFLLGILSLSGCGGPSAAETEVREFYKALLKVELGIATDEYDDYSNCLVSVLKDESGLSWKQILTQVQADPDWTLDNDLSEEGTTKLFACMAFIGEENFLQDLMDDADEDVISSGGNYGDNPVLDDLYNQCADGDNQACADLFWQSPSGSEYEAFGSNCGGRGGLCETFENDIPETDIPFFYGEDDFLDNLYDQCADGNDEACDDLFWQSVGGSEYGNFALTCGGRGCQIPMDGRSMNYGDNAYLDNLYDQCADGNDQACNDLYFQSFAGSEYEEFALTCGGRDCDITTLGIPMNYGDDNYLDDLYDSCADGDDWACQLLWEESPVDSEYESFALTCGGRDCEIETPNTVPWGGGSLDLDALYVDCSDGNDDACVLLSDLSPDSEIREFAKTCGGRGGDCSSFG